MPTSRLVNLSRDPSIPRSPGSDPIRDRATVGAQVPIDPDDDPWAYEPAADAAEPAGDAGEAGGDEDDDGDPVLRDTADGEALADDGASDEEAPPAGVEEDADDDAESRRIAAADEDAAADDDDEASAAAAAAADADAAADAAVDDDEARRMAAAAIAAADEDDAADDDAQERRIAAAAIAAADDAPVGRDTLRVGPSSRLPSLPAALEDDDAPEPAAEADEAVDGGVTVRVGPDRPEFANTVVVEREPDEAEDPALSSTVRVDPPASDRRSSSRKMPALHIHAEDLVEPIGDTVRVVPQTEEEEERETVRVTAEPRPPAAPDPGPEAAVEPLAEDLQLKTSASASGERKRTMRVPDQRSVTGRPTASGSSRVPRVAVGTTPGESGKPRPALLTPGAGGPNRQLAAVVGGIAVVLTLLLARCALADRGLVWQSSASAARAEARSSGRPLVVVVMDPKLPDCKLFAERVLASPQVQGLASGFVWLEERVDVKVVQGEDGPQLQLPAGVIAPPPLVRIYGSDGITPIAGSDEARTLTVDALCSMLVEAKTQ